MTRIETLCARGFRRLGSPARGFRYVNAEGRKVSRADADRIEALKIPPAWTDVCISSAASGTVQAVGKDAAGRWQYIYHDNHVRHRERKKFQRLIDFAEKLPVMRKTMAKDLRLRGLPRERVMASILRILSLSFIRPGSEIYANENGSYGLATLRPKHVTVKGDTVIFDFPGKSGVQQRREIRDRTTARIIKELLKRPGRDVFKYQNSDDAFVDVKRRHINIYIKEVMGRNFSAKDFRTWAGTVLAAIALREFEKFDSQAQAKKNLVQAIERVAERLGNTPTICRKCYIHPAVLNAYLDGETIAVLRAKTEDTLRHDLAKLGAGEAAVLAFLQQKLRQPKPTTAELLKRSLQQRASRLRRIHRMESGRRAA
jgi:DNA topoisomerase-1